MPVEAEVVYKDRDAIVAELITSWQARVPDVSVEPDSILRIWIEVIASSLEGLMLANQLLHDDMFPQTANILALMRYGDIFGRPILPGTPSTGTLRFAGAGGTTIPVGTTVAAPSSVDDALTFVTTEMGTLPNPGVPTAPTASDGGAGALPAGLYEYAVSFKTTLGETTIGAVSAPLATTGTKQIALTAIPIGGAGTTGRRLYRRFNGGDFGFVADINNNTATTLVDNNTGPGAAPLTDSTAEQVDVAAQSDDDGADFNVLVGTITDIADAVQGLSSVTNPVAFTGGSDPEDYEVYRSHLLDFMRNPQSGALADLESWAESVPGVEDATAINNDNLGVTTPGHVTVRISGPEGTVPAGSVVTAVQDVLNGHNLANIIIHVGTFTAQPVNVTVTITLKTGYVLADVSGSVIDAITEYILSVPVGGTVYKEGIAAAVFGLAGVATLVVNIPATDTALTSLQKAVPGTIGVS